jgi:hypothetical protein
MNWQKIQGLKYYIAYGTVVIGFFMYSGLTGLKWWNSTSTTRERSGTTHSRGVHYLHHK